MIGLFCSWLRHSVQHWWRLSRSSVTILAVTGIVFSIAAMTQLIEQRSSQSTPAIAPVFQVDVDSADEATLALLPGIGPALAGRIVEDRTRLGAFGGPAGLRRVRGIGPAISAEIEPFVLVRSSEK